MKGTIVKCMEELVMKNFGANKWKDSLKRSRVKENAFFMTTGDVRNGEVLAIMEGIPSPRHSP